jgi:hypothetical protein
MSEKKTKVSRKKSKTVIHMLPYVIYEQKKKLTKKKQILIESCSLILPLGHIIIGTHTHNQANNN